MEKRQIVNDIKEIRTSIISCIISSIF